MSEPVESRSAGLFRTVAVCAALLLGIDLLTTFLIRDPQQKLLYSDISSPIIDLLATIALFIAAIRSRAQSRRLYVAWWLIGLSAFTFTLGDLSWSIIELGLEEPPFPSIADAFYIAYYPLLLAGVFLLPQRSTTRGEQLKNVLDMGIVMVAAILGFWNYLLGPIMVSNAEYPLLEQLILLAYPVGDLVLLWALLRIIYKRSTTQDGSEVPAFFLAASFLVTIVGDSIYTYQYLTGTYVSGGLVDITWRATMLLTGLAGISQITTVQLLAGSGKFPSRLEAFAGAVKTITPYLAYVWLVAAYLLLVRGHFQPLHIDFFSLSLAVGGIIGLVLLRQTVTLYENSKLNVRLQIQTEELEKANQDLHKEIRERKSAEQKLMHDSLHDAMTGLPNRVLLLDRLGQAIEYCKRRSEDTFAVLFVDLDHFKVINDSLGHLAGDQMLIIVSKRMKESLRASDTVARLGGDEFAILLQITGHKNSALTIADKIQQVIKLPIQLNGRELHISASIGIVADIAGYDFPQEVLRDADIAMYRAKGAGKARSETFEISMRSQAFSRLAMEQDLHAALQKNELQLYYQPIFSLGSSRLASFEALIRWNHPERGLLSPADFLPVAEESGLILPIGKWILQEACAQLRKWHLTYPHLQDISINVNISNRQFSQPGFIEEVLGALQKSGLKAQSLKLEITESVLISNYQAANEIFTKLQTLGIQLQIDDFGSGYSALGYLQHFPISAIKIDKSFIDEIGKGRKGVELIRAIVSMSRELGMEAIAEGIETAEQLQQIKNLLCNFGQGYLLSRPLDQKAAETILKEIQRGESRGPGAV